jgi:hypothetical protein
MALEPRDYADLAATTDFRANRKLDSSGKRPIPPFAWAALGLAGLGVAYFATLDTGAPKLLTDPDSENFSTSTALPPLVPPKTQEPSAPNQDNVVKIEPQLPVAPPPPIITPAIPQTPQSEMNAQIPPIEAPMPPAAPLSVGQEPLAETAPDNSAEIARLRALREAEAERLRAVAEAQEQERQERLKSALVAFDGADAAAGGAPQKQPMPLVTGRNFRLLPRQRSIRLQALLKPRKQAATATCNFSTSKPSRALTQSLPASSPVQTR